jgi:hypothetical protein
MAQRERTRARQGVSRPAVRPYDSARGRHTLDRPVLGPPLSEGANDFQESVRSFV